MIYHSVWLFVGIACLVIVSYLEIRYYRLGFPHSWTWRFLLVGFMSMGILGCTFSFVPKPIQLFQNVGMIVVLVFTIILSAVIALYTVPRGIREADKNRNR